MTVPIPDEHSVCRICRAPLRLDLELMLAAAASMDPGVIPPLVFKCLNAHTERFWPALIARPAGPVLHRCAVCGIELRRGGQKTCSPEHRRFVARMRNEAQMAHYRRYKPQRDGSTFVSFHFPVEAQPWYRGAAIAFQPPAQPRWPVFPEIPADWLDGFRVAYPPIERADPEPELRDCARPEADVKIEERLRIRRAHYATRPHGPRTVLEPRVAIRPFPRREQ